MAYKLRKIYTSQDQFRLDVAKSNDLFDEEYYELSKESGQDSQYAELLAATKDNVSASFDKTVYDKLSGSDRFNYLVTENFMDKTTEDYTKNKAYFDQRITQIKNQEIYDSLSGFEKVVNSVGGWLANTIVTPVLGMVEGLVDAGAFIAGVFGNEDFENKMKDFIAKDAVGYQAVQQALNDYTARYTFNDKNWFSKAFNDISAGIARMTPMIVGNLLAVPTAGVSAVIGNTIYYAAMAGNTAEEAIHANPDIDYGALFGYTAGSVGLEMLTEWASGKLFGDDVVSAMLKGQKYTPKGSIFNAVLHNFGTEALEEATAELFGSMLYRHYVDQNADIASFGDIFYAALIGGLTGAIMTGGNIAFATKRYSVVDGKLIANNKLTEDQRKKANKISFSNLYALRQLSEQTQTKESEVTKLMAKYGKSVDDIRINHATEYDKAIKQDTETKKNQASAIIALANLMRDIGVEQFQRSSKLLEADIAEATTMVDNYFNHTDIYNKAASDAYSAAFPGQSYTPAAQIANEEQALTKALREAYPHLKVSFGTQGTSDGSGVRLVNGTKGWLFIESGLVEKQGFAKMLSQTIKYEIATDVMNQIDLLNSEHSDALATLVTEGRKTKYSDLTEAEKKSVADVVCFDPINNRRIFQRDNKIHSTIFNYITKESDALSKFGRKSEANKIKYKHLLEMRNMFIKNIADIIGNDTDIANIKKAYNLTDDEVKTKLVDKFIPTLLNQNVKLSELLLSEESIHRQEAIDELIDNRADTNLTTPFDWNSLYNEAYYSEEYVNSIKEQQKTQDFETALSAHIKAVHNVEFDIDAKNVLRTVINDQLSPKEITMLFNVLFTQEAFNDIDALTDTIYNIMQESETTQNTDSVVIANNQIKGTGKLKFFKGDVYEQISVSSSDGTRTDGVDSGRQIPRMVANTRQYSTTEIDEYSLEVQSADSLEEYQKTLINLTQEAYGVTLNFYKGNVHKGSKYTNTNVHGFYIEGTNQIYIRDDAEESLQTIITSIRHEVMHFLFAANQDLYQELIDDLEWIDTDFDMSYLDLRRDIIRNVYDDASYAELTEEAVVDAILNAEKRGNVSSQLTLVNAAADTFYKKAMNAKYSWFFTETLTKGYDTDIRNRIVQKGKVVKNLFVGTPKKLTDFPTTNTVVRPTIGEYHATWTQDRLNDLIERSGASNPNYANSYAVYMTIDQFLKLSTTSDTGRTNSISAIKEDYERQSDVNYSEILKDKGVIVPHLTINADTMRVEDHDGRHRLIGLQKQGIYWIAVKIDFEGNSFDKYNAKIYETLTLKPQEFLEGTRQNYTTDIHTVVPLNEANRTNLENLFIKERLMSTAGVRFSLSKQNKQETSMRQTNITSQDITKLASTEYKSGETKKRETKGFTEEDYEVAGVLDYLDKNESTIDKITTYEELETIFNAIDEHKIGDLESFFLLNALQHKLAYLFPNNRYAKAKEMLGARLSPESTKTAQKIAARSALFAETNPVKALSDDLSKQFDQEIKPSDGLVIKWIPAYANKNAWRLELKAEYDSTKALKDSTEDPYLREQYTLQLRTLNQQLTALAEEDTATLIGIAIKKLQETETDRTQNAEKILQINRSIVEDFISHVDLSGNKPIYNPNKKYILKPEHAAKIGNLLEKINSFRYLAMLSSPSTWGRNALTNTLISVNAIAEDALSKNIENTRLLRAESQARYTGDYDKNFSNFIDEKYKARIAQDTKGDKYHVKEIDALRQEWAQENDPMKKHEYLYKIKQLEQKALNDQPWTTRRVLRNLKGLLSGSMNLLSTNAYAELKALYKANSPEEIYHKMQETKSPLAKLFKQIYIDNKGNDMIGVIELAEQLSGTSVVLNELYNNALYRGNKLLFKTENILNSKINKLKEKHPLTAGLITMFIPFARTSWNTTAYIMNHSPIGLAKGVIKSLQTKHMYYGDMRQAITDYHKTEYIKQQKDANKEFKFDQKEFDVWCSKKLHTDVISAINGDYNSIKSVFNKYVELGRVNQSIVGSSDMFARANTIESITQGLSGTAWMALGLIIGALVDGFKIDDDDYLGPVLVLGDWRIKLDDLSPFSTMFSVGAVINSSDNFLDGFEKFAGILVDASMLNVIESAIQYSDGLVDYLGNQQISIVQQFIPAIAKNITKILDNSKKNKSGGFYYKLWNTTLSNLPFFSYLVANKIDPYTGETDKIYQSGLLEAIFNQIAPVGVRSLSMSDYEREARKVGAETTGLSGKFSVNDVNYTVKNQEKYAKYRADYIEKEFNLILSGKQKVTVEDDKGKRITTTYDKLTNKQKQNVINRLYTDATSMTKIKWWTDQGNTYVVTDRDLYSEYRKMFSNIVYNKNWSKSKFVES